MRDLDIGPIPATIPSAEGILGMTVQDMDVRMKRSTNITCSMMDKLLMALQEVYIYIGPALLPPINKLIILDHIIL